MADSLTADGPVVVNSTPKTKHQQNRRKRQKKKKANVGPTPAVPEDKKRTLALEYLHLWTIDKGAWSFKKKSQYWLLNNMYNKAQVSIN